jgi:hypothetical protein
MAGLAALGAEWQRWLRCWWRGYSGFRKRTGRRSRPWWITQSSLGAALAVSWQRFVGTALGAVVGAIAASYFKPHALVFACGILFLGLICGLLRSDQASYRFGGITLAIVMLVPRRVRHGKLRFIGSLRCGLELEWR